MRDLLVPLDHRRKLRIELERLVDRHFQLKRHGFGDLVHLRVGHIQRAPHVADDGARRHRAERDDLADAVRAVFARNIVDHFLPPFIAEVHVDIRHGDALGV